MSLRVSENGIEEISLPSGFLTAAEGEEKLVIEKGEGFERERLWVWRWRPRMERRRDIAAKEGMLLFGSDRRKNKTKQMRNGGEEKKQ